MSDESRAQTTEVPSRDIISLLEEVEPPAAMPQLAERERTPEPVPIPPSPPSPERRRERGEESRRLEEEVCEIPHQHRESDFIYILTII